MEPIETIQPEVRIGEADAAVVVPQTPTIDATYPAVFQWENPPWGLPTAIIVWGASVAVLVVMSILFAAPFLMRAATAGKDAGNAQQLLLQDPKFLVWQLVATIPGHLITLFVVWTVVTRFGKRPFWTSLRWGWGDIRNWAAIGLSVLFAVVLMVVSAKLANKIGGGQTMIDRLVESSRAARLLIALLAGVSAPLVEELVYRGMLYPAAQRGIARLGRRLMPLPEKNDSIQIASAILAVLLVSVLFAGVHVDQYRNNLGVIAGISLLSLALTGSRAVTGRVLPAFIIHLTFNGIQAVALVFADQAGKKPPPATPPAAFVLGLLHQLPFLH